MNNVDYIPFDKVLDDVTGGNPKILQSEYESSGEIPIVDQGSKLIGGFTNDKSKKYKGNLPVIVFGDHTKNIKYVDFDFALGADGTKILKVNKEFDSRFIFYYLGSLKLPDKVGYSRHYKYLKEKDIPLFSKDYQEKSRLFLDKANSIRQKRRETLRLADEFLRSTFLEMFGDPYYNPRNYKIVEVGDIVKEVKYGTSKPAVENGKYKYLRMNNITYEGRMDLKDLKYIDIEDDQKKKYLVRKGDLLFNRTNSKELVGKTAVFKEDEEMIIAGYLLRVRTNELANPDFLSAYLNSNYGKKVLSNMCKNIIGMANINAQEFQSIKIYLPPIKLQNKFAVIVEKTEQLKRKYGQSLQESENLFNSLMQRAFRGEL